MHTIADICKFLEQVAPLHIAEEWDNVGLIVGDDSSQVKKVMTCLTVTPESAEEALASDCDLIVTHHPVLFRPTQRITNRSPDGAMLLSLLCARIAVYSPHTAFDNAPGGINDILCSRLGLEDITPLRKSTGPLQSKIVVFIPESDLSRVSDALFNAGAGFIGEYSQCSFRTAGTGTFFGSENANPTIGRAGQREEAPEYRLEVLCPAGKVGDAITAMRAAHSYEEPAFDVYPLEPRPLGSGTGRIGRTSQPISLSDLCEIVKSSLKITHVHVVGDLIRSVRKVAVACGAAGEFAADAARLGAEVFLTGEMRFHEQLAAKDGGLSVILTGHYASERPGVEEWARIISREFPELTVWPSREEKDVAKIV